MTEPTEAQIKEACDLLTKEFGSETARIPAESFSAKAAVRLIAQRDTERAEHEAFRQRVRLRCDRSLMVQPIRRPRSS